MSTKWIPTPEHLQVIIDLASRGCSEDNIATTIGISPATWYLRKKEITHIQECVRIGRAKAETMLSNVVWDIATNDAHRRQLDAAKFMLERKHKWSEKVEVIVEPLPLVDISGDDLLAQLERAVDRPIITVN